MVVGNKETIKLGFVISGSVLGSIVVSISACHAEDRGSIPRRGEFFFCSWFPCDMIAILHTGPLSICRDSIVVSTLRCGRNNPGSNPGHGTFFFTLHFLSSRHQNTGLVRDLNPGPLAPKARIIPLDQRAMPSKARPLGLGNEKRKQTYIYLGNPTEPRRGGRVVKALDC